MSVEVVALEPHHWPEVARIYREGIETRLATFETEVPSWQAWDAARLREHRFAAVDGERVLGWVAVGPVSGRSVYRGVVEDSVYVGADARGRGVGSALLARLVASTEAAGIWTIQSGIFPENQASLRLHERAGFVVVGCRRRLAQLDGVWRDVLLVERRSERAGA